MINVEVFVLNLLHALSDPRYYLPIFVALGLYLVTFFLKRWLLYKLDRLSRVTETSLDDLVFALLQKTKHFFLLGVALYLGFKGTPLNEHYGPAANRLFLFLVSVQSIIWGREAIDCWIKFTLEKRKEDPSLKTSLGFLGLILKFGLISAILLFVLNNMGVNVSTFVTGLGVGGVAIALATQNILGDLFSSLSIVLDKPFVVGDFVSLGEWLGTIEHVGLKTTRLRSLSGEQIVISNSDLLSSKIRNYKRMQERRVVFQVSVTYETSREKLKRIPELLKEIVQRQERTRFDRGHFVRYGQFSLDFEVVYWILVPDYNAFADIHQQVLFEIHEAFEQQQIRFALPFQKLLLENQSKVS